jgi:regulator of replication initiation timing
LKLIPKISKKSREGIYITKGEEFKLSKQVDVVLSPQFYWVRREELKIEKERDALKVAPATFESQFDSLENISFLALKSGENSYLFIAYNIVDILNRLESEFGISEKEIGNIYTAQTEFFETEQALSSSSEKLLVVVDGIVSEIVNHSQNSSVESANEYLSRTSRSQYSMKFRGARDDTSKGRAFLYASVIPLFLSLSLGVDIWKISEEKSILKAEIEKKRERYNLPSTSFQMKSIKNRFFQIEREQKKVRDDFLWLKSEKFERYGKVEDFSSSPREFSFRIKLSDKKFAKNIRESVQKRDSRAGISGTGDIVKVDFR